MGKVLEAVSTSDWHLDGGISRLFPHNALDKQLHEIRKPFNYCVENGLRHLFNPGDISDKARLSEETLIALITLLISYKRINFYYILGNHDFARVGKTAIDVLKVLVDNDALRNVHLFHKPTVREIDGVDVCFLPYPFNKVPKNERPLLVFAHGEEPGAMGDYGQPLKVKDDSKHKIFRSKEDFVISGHVHQYQYLKNSRWIFNGSLYQKTFGEKHPKGFVAFNAKYKDRALKVGHEHIDSQPEFRLIDILIESERDWKRIEKSENEFYRVSIGEGVIVPKGLTREIPNVISINGKSNKQGVVEGEIAVAKNMPKITPLTGLVEFLMANKLEKKEIKLAVGLVKEAIEQINAEYGSQDEE